MSNDLKGTPVLVHPELGHDPAGQQNQVGIISQADLVNDDIFVDFGGVQGLYSSDALLVLLPDEQIHQNLADVAYETPFAELKALTQIDLFLHYGGENGKMKAIAIAQANPAIQTLCLDTLQNQVALNISKSYGRE